MKCEQFLFEASYLFESGERDNLGQDAQDHLCKCASCQAQFQRIRSDFDSLKHASALMRQRLHQAIDLVIADESSRFSLAASFSRAWLQMVVALLVLVGSISGVVYQDYPTETTPVYARR
jgi:hypothetical protein